MPGEGPAAAVRQRPGAGRRPAGLAGGPADRGAAGGCARAGGAVRAAAAGAGGGLRLDGGRARPGGVRGEPRLALAGGGAARAEAVRARDGETRRGLSPKGSRRRGEGAGRRRGARDGEAARAEAERQREKFERFDYGRTIAGGPPGVAGEQRRRHPGLARQHPSRPSRVGVALRPSPLPFRLADPQGAHRCVSLRRRSAPTGRGS